MWLEKAQKTLQYERSKRGAIRKPKLKRKDSTVREDFEGAVIETKASKYLVALTIVTFIFVIVSVAIAVFVNLSGNDNQYSPEKILITTDAPGNLDSASSVLLQIKISNRNPVVLQRVRLSVTYPEGVYRVDERGIRSNRDEFEIGSLGIGDSITQIIKPSIYGQANEEKTIRYELEYRAEGSQQPVVKKAEYTFSLRNAPIVFSPIKHTTPISGKEMTISFTVQSNTIENLRNVRVHLRYPSEFVPHTSSEGARKPDNDEVLVWSTPFLSPGEVRDFSVTGVIRENQNREQSIVLEGFLPAVDDEGAGIKVARTEKIFTVGSSFFDIAIKLNGKESDEFLVSPSSLLNGTLELVNLDSEQLEDLIVRLDFSGTGLNESTIDSPYGYYDEIQKQLIWTPQEMDDFAIVRAGEEFALRFSFEILPNRLEFAQPGKTVSLNASATAFRVSTGATESLRNIAATEFLVSSVLQVSANTLYSTSTIPNTGSIPPRVGRVTSYVLQYFLKNSGNKLTDVELSFTLPRGVELTGQYAGIVLEEFSYDEADRRVTVAMPSLEAYGSRSGRAVEIQVQVRPSSTDVDEFLQIASAAEFRARDSHTGKTYEGRTSPLTTQISVEPVRDDGTVRE